VIRHNGKPYNPERLSVDSHNFLAGIGVETTLHSMRHSFATDVGRATKDPMFVRDILGHDSVATTQIYMDTDLEGRAREACRLLGGDQRSCSAAPHCARLGR
jgi:integrase